MAQRGVIVSREAIRCWGIKFGPLIAANIRRRRPSPTGRWHPDEMVCKIGGRPMWLWRAVDDEGEVLDFVMQRHRDTKAALRLIRRLLRNQPVAPTAITTDRLKSYDSALAELGLSHIHHDGEKRENNWAENSDLPIRRRERQQQGFKSEASAQRFLTSHAAVYNTFYTARHLITRPTLRLFRTAAFGAWSQATCAEIPRA